MKKPVLHLDFETRSTLDLKKVGLHRYADPEHTSVICMAYAFDDDPVELLYEANYIRVLEHIREGGKVWAHNAQFERIIWNMFWVEPKLKIEQMVCTMTMAYAMGLPGSLANCAAALGIEQQKDLEGQRLMLQLSKPRDDKDGVITWWDDEERLQRLYNYCKQDVVVEREVGKRMMQLSPYEKKVWYLDQVINDRGITVDRKAVEKAVEIVENQKDFLNKEIRRLSKNQIATVTAVQQIKDYLEFYGVAPEKLSKSDVTELLASDNLDPHARQILELRSQGGKAATAKLQPMLDRTTDNDPRLRGCFQYSGANTRRWSGRGVQLQNLKRPGISQSEIEFAITTMKEAKESSELFSLLYDKPLDVVSNCTRGFLTAAPGHELIICDFASIEARVLAWLAGQEDVLEIFRQNKDLYLVQASKIFHTNIVDKEDWRRQIGKVAILALGYQGGVGAFQQMAKAYNVKMEPAYKELWRAASADDQQRAEERYKQAGTQFDISKEEFLASELTKIAWRSANANIVEYWSTVENAFVGAISNTGAKFKVGTGNRCIEFKTNGSFLWCRLPSGGVLCYPYPEIKKSKNPWGSSKKEPSYMSEDGQSHKWQRFTVHGGSIAENITQAVARDLLADAMLRLEARNYRVIAHVHDEVVCEMPIGKGSLDEMSQIMNDNPSWAKDLPTASSGHVSFRYRK